MKTLKTLSISEARKDIFNIADQASKPGKHVILTENGQAKVVMMAVEEFESWKETMEVEAILPNLGKDIEDARQAYKKGNYITLDQILAKEGYVLADKGKKYAIRNSSAAKSAKRPGQSKRKV